MPPEMDLLYRYKEIDSSSLIFPFDMPIQNRRKYVAIQKKDEIKWVSALNHASANGLIPDTILPSHKEFIAFNNWFFEIGQSNYFIINRTVTTDSIRAMMKFEYEYFPILLDKVQILSEYKQWYNQNRNDWFVRNDIMTNNILKYIERFKPKTVVVFTGLLHKYILTDLLNSYNKEQKYALIEYFVK
jgi:hypothetical protein